MPAPVPGPPARGQPLVLVFAVMLALALWFTTRGWHAAILDRHEFRQLQTAVSTYWIKEAGYRLDYETPLFGPPWSIPFEFPLYQWCVAATSRLLGTGLEPTARGVSLFFFFATLPAVYGLAGILGLTPTRRLLVVSTVLASPTYLFYARTFMIETTALCCAAWFLYTVTRAVHDNSGRFACLAALLAMLAGLAKVTTFAMFLPPTALLTWLAWRHRWTNRIAQPAGFRRATAFAIAPVLIGVLASAWWVRHGDHLKQANPFANFLVSDQLVRWTWGTWDQRLSFGFWAENWRNISGLVLGPMPLAVLALCAFRVAPLHRRTAGAAAAFFLGALLLFANLYNVHDYYYCASAVFLLGGAGFLLAGVWDSTRLPVLVKWLAVILVLGGQLHLYYMHYGPYQRRPLPAPPGIAAVIRSVVPQDDVILIYGWDWNALLPYYAERRAVMVPYGREQETGVLDGILRPLARGRLTALVVRHAGPQPASPELIRERLNHFRLAPAPFASSADGDLYLPEELMPAATLKATGLTFPGVTLHPPLPADSFAGQLHEADLSAVDLPMTSLRPTRALGLFGVNVGSEGGRRVILAHAVSELQFVPPAGTARIDAEVGLADAAYAPANPSPTDGVTVEIFELRPDGAHRTLYRRDLDPARKLADRGPQSIRLDDLAPLTGRVVFRISPGPKNNLTSDWAYWGRIEFR